mmetsp:Transcript_45061/g.50218  ORF Transcript_45061/g.50218 Transcript_45061/m.50218 type:complete len:211 (-) Transcript_45061:122-754(-)
MNIILSSLIISFFVAIIDSCYGEPCLSGTGTYGGDFGQYDMAACEKCATQKTSGQCCLSIYYNSNGRSKDFEYSPNDGGCVKIGKRCSSNDEGCAPGLVCGSVYNKTPFDTFCGYPNVVADCTFVTFPGSSSTIQIPEKLMTGSLAKITLHSIRNGKSNNNINNSRLYPTWDAAVAVVCFLVVVVMATYWKVARHRSQDQYIEVEHDVLL